MTGSSDVRASASLQQKRFLVVYENINVLFSSGLKPISASRTSTSSSSSSPPYGDVDVSGIKKLTGAGLNHEFICVNKSSGILCKVIAVPITTGGGSGEGGEIEYLRRQMVGIDGDMNIAFPLKCWRAGR